MFLMPNPWGTPALLKAYLCLLRDPPKLMGNPYYKEEWVSHEVTWVAHEAHGWAMRISQSPSRISFLTPCRISFNSFQ